MHDRTTELIGFLNDGVLVEAAEIYPGEDSAPTVLCSECSGLDYGTFPNIATRIFYE